MNGSRVFLYQQAGLFQARFGGLLMTGYQTWLAASLVSIGLLPVAVQAAYVTGVSSSPIILTDDFETPISGGTGYNLGASPVDIGPWDGTAGISGNNYTTTVSGNGGQVMQVVARYSSSTNITYIAPQHPKSSYIEFDIKPGINSTVRTGDSKTWSLYDSNGGKTVMTFGITRSSDANHPNTIYVLTPTATAGVLQTTYYDVVDGSEFVKVNIQLTAITVNATVKDWSYNLWLDNQLITSSPVLFSTLGNGASQADKGAFSFVWQDSAVTQIDNFSWKTDGFTRPIPEPASLGLLGLSCVLILGTRQQSNR